MDWPNWRGPELNGVSRGKRQVDRWTPEGENVLWKRTDLGGRSTPICMRGKLYMLVRDHPDTAIEGEKVVCLDAATGKTLWENVFNVFLSDVPGPRVAWSSVVGDPETGNVFSEGVCGFFQCINGSTGETIWKHSLSERHGIISAFGGPPAFPVICGNRVDVKTVFDWATNRRRHSESSRLISGTVCRSGMRTRNRIRRRFVQHAGPDRGERRRHAGRCLG